MNASLKYVQWVFAVSLIATTIAACSESELARDQHVRRANDFFAAAQYEKAEAEYRDVLRSAPADPVATRQLGIIYHEEGRSLQSLPLLKKSAELRPEDPDLQLKLGLTYLSLHAYSEAREAALRVLEKQPGQEYALLILADTTPLQPKDAEEAQKIIEDLREKDSDRAGYHLALGQLALRQNDQARAERELTAGLKLDPQSSLIHFALAHLYWSRKDLKQADQEFKTAADLAAPRSPGRMRYIDFKLQTGAIADAKAMLGEMNAKAPDYLPPRVYLMKFACAEHPNEDCAGRVRNILAEDPINYDALLIDGSLNLAKGENAKALRELEQLSNIYPRAPQARYQLALAYLQNPQNTNTVDNAVNSLNVALGLDPHFDQATLLLAELRIRKGQYAATVDSLTQLIKERPQIAQAHLLLASAYLAQRNPDQALVIYRQMTALFPKNPQPPFLIGSLQLARGQQGDARKSFEKALEISPDYLLAMEKLVDLDLADKYYASAVDRVQKEIDRNPKLGSLWAIRAKIFLEQRDFTHAEPDLLKAIELDPSLERAYVLLAGLYVASNRQEEAIEKLKAFVAKNDKDVIILMQLATIHEQLKHYDAARDAYEKLLAVNPRFLPALNNLAYIDSERLGWLDAAYDLAKRAREVAPNEPHSADTLGWILFKRGEYGNASPLLQESAAKLPAEPEVQFHLGMAHYMLGEDGPARVALQKAADADKEFPGKEEARQRLGILAIDAKTANTAARTELENYLRERPSDPEALVRLGDFQQRDGTLEQAVKTYEKIVDAYPQFAPATRQLALLSGQRSGDNQKTYDLVTKARQAYPGDPELARTSGVISYRRGLYSQSAELLKQVTTNRADDPELVYYLGMSYYQLKQYADAQSELQRALGMNLAPKLAQEARRALDEPEFAKASGVDNYRRGNYSQAAEQLQKVAAQRAQDPELLYYLGMAYYQLKQPTNAKGPLQQALALNLPPNFADEARRALADCCEEKSN